MTSIWPKSYLIINDRSYWKSTHNFILNGTLLTKLGMKLYKLMVPLKMRPPKFNSGIKLLNHRVLFIENQEARSEAE
jgi:hypothetical protein